MVLFAADAGAFVAPGFQDVGMAGVGIASAQVFVKPAGLHRVVGVDRVGKGELAHGLAHFGMAPSSGGGTRGKVGPTLRNGPNRSESHRSHQYWNLALRAYEVTKSTTSA